MGFCSLVLSAGIQKEYISSNLPTHTQNTKINKNHSQINTKIKNYSYYKHQFTHIYFKPKDLQPQLDCSVPWAIKTQISSCF